MRNPTASALHRVIPCPPSHLLPHTYSTSPEAAKGTVGHEALYRLLKEGMPSKEWWPEWLSEYYLSQIPWAMNKEPPNDRIGWLGENTFRYNVKTGEAEKLGEKLGRGQYPQTALYEIIGTMDVVHPSGVVIDYKFDGCESHTAPAKENPQLLFGALCLRSIYGVHSIEVALIHFRQGVEKPWYESATVGDYELDVFALELQAMIERLHRMEPPYSVTRGPHCRYCPAVASCPAVKGLIQAIAATSPQSLSDQILATLTPETASAAYQRYKQVAEVMGHVGRALAAYADERDIDLGNGKCYGHVTTSRDQIDGRIAHSVLAEYYGAEIADKACELSATKASIARALDISSTSSKTARGIYDAIREAGGVTAKSTRAVREHRKQIEE